MDSAPYHLANPLQHGPPIRALQTLLNHKGFPVHIDGIFGPATAHACVEAKKELGYPVSNQRPCAGPDLIRKLNGLPDKRPAPMPVKARFIQELRWMIEFWSSIHYSNRRPIPYGQKYRTVPINSDCSGTISIAAHWAGCPDPNGEHYNGNGFTGTMLAHCHHISAEQAEPGDLIVFGNYPGHHVCAILARLSGGDFELFSHGHEGGLRQPIKFSAERRYQPAAISFLRFV